VTFGGQKRPKHNRNPHRPHASIEKKEKGGEWCEILKQHLPRKEMCSEPLRKKKEKKKLDSVKRGKPDSAGITSFIKLGFRRKNKKFLLRKLPIRQVGLRSKRESTRGLGPANHSFSDEAGKNSFVRRGIAGGEAEEPFLELTGGIRHRAQPYTEE